MSDAHPHVHQSATYEVSEVMNSSDCFETNLAGLANKLDSGESLAVNMTFTVDLMTIATPSKEVNTKIGWAYCVFQKC